MPRLQTLLALALVAALAYGPSQAQARQLHQAPSTITGLAIILSNENAAHRMLLVHTPDGRYVQVQATAEQLAAIRSGMAVTVTGSWRPAAGGTAVAAASPTAGSFQAEAIRALGGPSARPQLTQVAAPAGNAATAAASAITLSSNALAQANLSTVFIPIAHKKGSAACPGTKPPAYTVAQVKAAVFQELSPAGVTAGATFRQCSGGRSQLTAANSAVLDPVTLGCAGNTSWGAPWTTAKCEFDDHMGWAEAADAAVAARGIDLSKYKYRVYLLPPGTCLWVGLGFMGCDGSYTCRTWIAGEFWATPQAYVHELGHNLFLAHAGASDAAGKYIDDYADLTSTMGWCCSDRCPNTAESWQLGWLSLQQLDGASLAPGRTLSATIYAQHLAAGVASRVGGLRIKPTWAAGAAPIFVGYRQRAGGDATLDPALASRVHVYFSNTTGTFDPQLTDWRTPTGLLKGGAWSHAATGLVLRVTDAAASTATLTVCRKAGAETLASCQAGLDYDCNGLTSSRDAACVKLLAAAAAKKNTTATSTPPPAAKGRATAALIRRPAAA